MSPKKDKEDTFIDKLGRLEEAGKSRERSDLEDLLSPGNGELEDDLPLVASASDPALLS